MEVTVSPPPCKHCGTPCARNEYGDWVCVGDPNCFLFDINDALCHNCGRPYHAHGFGMGNADPNVGECMEVEGTFTTADPYPEDIPE